MHELGDELFPYCGLPKEEVNVTPAVDLADPAPGPGRLRTLATSLISAPATGPPLPDPENTDYLADGTLTFTGRVIDEHVAATMNKAYLLPLLPVCPENAPILFLDGSSSLNTTKSTGCIAWHIPPVPPSMKEEDADGKTPPKKKAKKVIGTSKIHHH